MVDSGQWAEDGPLHVSKPFGQRVLRRRTPQIDCLWSDRINVYDLRHDKEEKSQG